MPKELKNPYKNVMYARKQGLQRAFKLGTLFAQSLKNDLISQTNRKPSRRSNRTADQSIKN
ncbi:MAG: hypothetical protein KBT79_17270, partial [Thalassolituus oleivorans]|nr:hypothetical protein [Thalassolituus oleivorans]